MIHRRKSYFYDFIGIEGQFKYLYHSHFHFLWCFNSFNTNFVCRKLLFSKIEQKITWFWKVVILFTVFSIVAFRPLVDFKINNIFFGHFRKKKNCLLCKFIISKTGAICWIPPQGFSPPLFNFCLEILHGEKLKVEHIGVLRCAWPVYARGSW